MISEIHQHTVEYYRSFSGGFVSSDTFTMKQAIVEDRLHLL